MLCKSLFFFFVCVNVTFPYNFPTAFFIAVLVVCACGVAARRNLVIFLKYNSAKDRCPLYEYYYNNAI